MICCKCQMDGLYDDGYVCAGCHGALYTDYLAVLKQLKQVLAQVKEVEAIANQYLDERNEALQRRFDI